MDRNELYDNIKLMFARLFVGLFMIAFLYAFYAAFSIWYIYYLELPQILKWHFVLMLTVGMLTGLIGQFLYDRITEFAYL